MAAWSSMRSERARIDRRLAVSPGAEVLATNREIVTFRDEWGTVAQTFDLAKLGLSHELMMLFADAFRMHYAGSAVPTRKGCWKALRAFAHFVVEDGGIAVPANLTTEAVGRYILWLDRQRSRAGEPWSTSTRHGRFVHVKMMLTWAMRNRTDRLSAPLSFPYNPFSGRHRTAVPRRLSAPQLKAILGACYEEIDAAWAGFEDDRRSDTVESKKPSRSDIRSLVPFFLAIGIQTAANPEALRLIRRDCLAPHPLDENRVVIDWAKPRAGGEVRRAQRRSFDRRRPYAAPNLIDRVAAITEPLVAEAQPSERDHLFLVRGNRPIGVGTIRYETLRIGIRRFIARANTRIAAWNNAHSDRPRAPLPNFAPVLFRGSVATEHYHAAGGDIRTAQAVLNHARADTTDLYVRGPEARRLQEETVARLQRLMVAWITGDRSPSDRAGGGSKTLIALGKNADAFGYTCANPLAGIASGATPGRLCPRFGACLTCPGLVIPIDVEHLARVLQAKRKLEWARDRIDPNRWQLLYAPSHRILTEDILPDFPADLHAAAERMVPALPSLPDLE
jgi:integrase